MAFYLGRKSQVLLSVEVVECLVGCPHRLLLLDVQMDSRLIDGGYQLIVGIRPSLDGGYPAVGRGRR